jgi:beta-lactam-binding protein with PASTA domain
VLALLVGGLFALVQSRRLPSHVIPTLANRTLAAARRELAPLDIELRSDGSDYSDQVPSGQIISQVPRAGQKLKEGSTVTVRVSKGVEPVPVPTLTGQSLEGARALITDRGLTMSNPPTFSSSETVPEGQVIDWSPKGRQPLRTLVRVVISSGLPTVAVPKVSGLLPADAERTLATAGLAVAQAQAYSEVTAKGKVAFTTPKSGTEIKKGETVTVYVSRGPERIAVPNVVGMSPADATAALRAAGLSVSSTVGAADVPVQYTRPRRTTLVRRGSSIVLYTNVVPPDVTAVSTTALASALPATTAAPAAPATTKR